MACDIRIAGTKAKFGQPEVDWHHPGWRNSAAAQIVGPQAKEMIFTAQTINAEEALRIGLVSGRSGRSSDEYRLIWRTL